MKLTRHRVSFFFYLSMGQVSVIKDYMEVK